jgi:Holliday junction resolvase
MRLHGKVDANHAEVVKALRKIGATVQSLAAIGAGCPDILVGWHGQNLLLEIKDGSKHPYERKLTSAQVAWFEQWSGGPVVVVQNSADAVEFVLSLEARQ